MKGYILCCGRNGRAVIYTRLAEPPTIGQSCITGPARMIIYWAGRSGLLGVAAKGPENGSRITAEVPSHGTDRVAQYLECTEEGAAAIDAWPPAC